MKKEVAYRVIRKNYSKKSMVCGSGRVQTIAKRAREKSENAKAFSF
jgi:hypothetical protein